MSYTTALLTANIPLIPSRYNRDILAIYAPNNRVLKEHRFISLIARRRRVRNSISKPVGRTQRWQTRASPARHQSFNGRSVILALRFMSACHLVLFHPVPHNILPHFRLLTFRHAHVRVSDARSLRPRWNLSLDWTRFSAAHFVRPSLFRKGERLDR